MSALPPNWGLDYDGTRWFYTYKPTGHIQYHFPSEGDEFPDFIDAASPAPALAPEERLESQRQQVRRAQTVTGGHGGHGHLPVPGRQGYVGGSGRDFRTGRSREGAGMSGMSATAMPVSNVYEDIYSRNDAPFQPESFMYLGPGSYNDVSPLIEEEDEAARRVVAGSSPGSSLVTPDQRSRHGGSPMLGVHALPAHSPHFSPPSEDGSLPPVSMLDGQEIHMLDGRETVHMLDGEPVVHMLDGREVPVELEGITRFNPVGIVAEMGTGATERATVENEPVEMHAGDSTAPIERVAAERAAVEAQGLRTDEAEEQLEEALERLKHQKALRINERVSGPGSDATAQPQQFVAPVVSMGVAASEQAFSPGKEDSDDEEALLIARMEAAAPKQSPDQPQAARAESPKPNFTIARKPAGAKYQPYAPGKITDRQSEDVAGRKTGSVPIRRDPSLMMSSKYMGQGAIDPESIPQSLALRSTQPQGGKIRQTAPEVEQGIEDVEQTPESVPHPSGFKPSRKSNRDSAGSSKTVSALAPDSPTDPAVEPEQKSGITKFPSVLKPARGRAPSIPPKHTSTWPLEHRPKKLYEQPHASQEQEDETERRYVPYTEPRDRDAALGDPYSSQRPYSDVEPTIESLPDLPQPASSERARPVSAMPAIETTPAPDWHPSAEQHLPYRLVRANSSEVHQPKSISAHPEGGPRPIADFAAMPSLAFVSGGVPSPSSSDQTPPLSPKKAAGGPENKETSNEKAGSPGEVSPLRSRETSLSNSAQQTPSPIETLRRGSSVVSHAQTVDGMSTWTPSPQSETPPSATQALPPQRKLSGLRHPVSHTSDDNRVKSPPSSTETPLESGPLGNMKEEATSYFPAPESLRRMSLPYSLLDESDASSPAAPTPPPKNPERQPLQRSKSLQEKKSPELRCAEPLQQQLEPIKPTQLETSPALDTAPDVPASQIQMGGHVLHAIEEGDEDDGDASEGEVITARRVVMERHSMSSGSIQLSPPRGKVKEPDLLASGSPSGQGTHQRTVSQPVQEHFMVATEPPVQQPRLQQDSSEVHQREAPRPTQAHPTAQQPQQAHALRTEPLSQPHPAHQAANMQAVAHQRSISQPINFGSRQAPAQHLQPHQVPRWQIPQGQAPAPHAQYQGHSTPSSGPQQPWHVPMPPPQSFPFGTTTQVSSPGQRERERGWKKLFKKTPTKEAPPQISAPALQTPPPQMHATTQMQYYVPLGQMPPNVQQPTQWPPGAPAWQPPQLPHPPMGSVQLPPAVGERPGVSKIPGFEVTDVPSRMPTVRRNSALGSNPFDANVMPAPLFDKETAP